MEPNFEFDEQTPEEELPRKGTHSQTKIDFEGNSISISHTVDSIDKQLLNKQKTKKSRKSRR